MIHPDLALETILKDATPLPIEETAVIHALGMILAENVFSEINLPAFRKSAMDGYAVIDADRSATLRIVEVIPAGEVPKKSLNPGECSKIMTGAMLPNGADKVIPFERVRESQGAITIIDHDDKRKNFCQPGENIARGRPVLPSGTLIRPQEIATLSAVGRFKIKVFSQPRIGIVCTGNEIVTPGSTLQPATCYDSNGPQLYNQTAALHLPVNHFGIARDEESKILGLLEKAIAKSDVLIVSGGVSKGDFDFVPNAIKSLGCTIHFKEVAFKPGRPFLFARKDKTFIFGFPGNPVATFVLFETMMKPLFYRLMGHSWAPKARMARLKTTIHRKTHDRVEFLPVLYTLDDVEPLGYHGPSHINVFCRANGLIRLEQGQEIIESGTLVKIQEL